MEQVFDRKAFRPMEQSLKRMVQARYDNCLYACNEEKFQPLAPCKQGCYQDIIVPYKIVNHQAADSEENLYRQCLANKFPHITQEDYVVCTKNIYAQRSELLMSHFAQTAEDLLASIH